MYSERCSFHIFPEKLYQYKTYRIVNMSVSIITTSYGW